MKNPSYALIFLLCVSAFSEGVLGEKILYDGLTLSSSQLLDPFPAKPTFQLNTKEGLSLYLSSTGAICEVQVKGKRYGRKGDWLSGFFVRDVIRNSICKLRGNLSRLKNGTIQQTAELKEASLIFKAVYEAHPDFIKLKGSIRDISGKDRAITLYFALPIEAIGWLWWDDIVEKRSIKEGKEYINAEENCPFGANGKHSRYPLATISTEDKSLTIAIPMDKPVVHRLFYNPQTKQFIIAFDFALVKDTLKFPSHADFEFLIYTSDPRWGFRSALEKYYSLYPSFFVKRTKKEGGWYVWGNMKDTPEAAEAGFMFHWGPSGPEAVKYDNEKGFYSLQYNEIEFYQLSLGDFKENSSYNDAIERLMKSAEGDKATLDILDKLSYTGGSGFFGQMPRKEYFRQISKAVLKSALYDENGKTICMIGNFPWIGNSGWGAIFPCNLDPDIPDGYGRFDMDVSYKSAFELYKKQGARLDGFALDSYGGYGDDKRINFRREHFPYVDFPLTFSFKEKRPVIIQYFSLIEWTKALAERYHPQGLLLMANCAWGHAPAFLTFAAPYLDVFGAEAPYHPDPRFIRSIAYHKSCTDLPYSPRPEWEVKFHLLYGIFPGHGNDLNLLKKYNPYLQILAKAGWEPVPYAYSDNEKILMERFGKGKTVYLSIHNPADEAQSCYLFVEIDKLGLKNIKASNLLTGETLRVLPSGKKARIQINISPKDTFVIKIDEVKEMKPAYLERYKYPRLILMPTGKKGDFDSELVDCFKMVLDYDKGVGELYQKDGYYYAVYTGFDGESYRCGLLRSKDLLSWEKLGLILDTGKEREFDYGSAGGGIAFKWKNKFYLVYTGYPFKGYENGPGKIGLAVSTDLIHWKKLGVILEPEKEFKWEAGGLYQPFPLIYNGKFYLFYNAKNEEENWIEQTGLAISELKEPFKFIKYPNNPVLPVGDTGSWDSRFSSDPWVIRIGGKWHMFYYGFNGVHAQDGVAFSDDLIKWNKSPFNPILEVGEAGSYDGIHAHKPCVVFKGGVYYHFYCAVGSKGRCIALATSVPLVQENEIH